MVERLTLMHGDTLRQQFTQTDPVWEEPWSGEHLCSATAAAPYEYACHEGNDSLRAILRGARLLEVEAQRSEAVGPLKQRGIQ